MIVGESKMDCFIIIKNGEVLKGVCIDWDREAKRYIFVPYKDTSKRYLRAKNAIYDSEEEAKTKAFKQAKLDKYWRRVFTGNYHI